MKKRRPGKLAIYATGLIILLIGFYPDLFHIPLMLRPWIFLAVILFIFASSVGVFNS